MSEDRPAATPVPDDANLSWMEKNRRRWKAAQAAQRFQKLNKKATLGSRVPNERSNSWCFRKAPSLMKWTTIGFCVMGIVLIAMGIYGVSSKWSEMFTIGPGVTVIVFGVITCVVALTGYYGFKKDNKCMLLIYFLVVGAALLTLIVVGAVALFADGALDDRFSKWWCDFKDSAENGQNEFDCCGYECYLDRPAKGGCPAGFPVPDPARTVTCDDPDPLTAGKAACVGITEEGCKDKGLDFVHKVFIPLFACTFAFGFLLLVGFCVAFYLICRPTPSTKSKMKPMPKALDMHAFKPGQFGALQESAATGAGPLPAIVDEEGGGAGEDAEAGSGAGVGAGAGAGAGPGPGPDDVVEAKVADAE